MIVPKELRPPERFKPIWDDGYGMFFVPSGQFLIPKDGEYYWAKGVTFPPQILRMIGGCMVSRHVIMVPVAEK